MLYICVKYICIYCVYALHKAMFLCGQAMMRTNGSMLQVGSLAWSCKAPGLRTPSLYKAWQGLTSREWLRMTQKHDQSTAKALNPLRGAHSERNVSLRERVPKDHTLHSTHNSHVTVWELEKKGPARMKRWESNMNLGMQWGAKICRVLYFLSLSYFALYSSRRPTAGLPQWLGWTCKIT